MYEDILVPTDGSPGTMQAIEHALELAKSTSTVHILSVVDQRVYLAAGGDQQDAVIQSLRDEAIEAVEQCADECRGKCETTTAVREGVPHRIILEYAEEHDIDVVVMGTHGRTGRDKLTSLGSVTERVVENAKRPVLVVHIDE
ncbi:MULTISPECIES: universal stress protein [Haloferax]|uniref:Universal stress protein n=2 Tax=Haloferax TaxID=2251 RepID=A0A6G1Z4T4_9EURY|nr:MULTISPECIES: universal stress protein [Haloferax]KAB1189282.1 universal stress protein [Haloferax sp. CBA1149]MRW81560.1 universal stress protein [Haloferax marinisediminis]